MSLHAEPVRQAAARLEVMAEHFHLEDSGPALADLTECLERLGKSIAACIER